MQRKGSPTRWDKVGDARGKEGTDRPKNGIKGKKEGLEKEQANPIRTWDPGECDDDDASSPKDHGEYGGRSAITIGLNRIRDEERPKDVEKDSAKVLKRV